MIAIMTVITVAIITITIIVISIIIVCSHCGQALLYGTQNLECVGDDKCGRLW